MIPSPFSKIHIAIGEPYFPPRRMDDAQMNPLSARSKASCSNYSLCGYAGRDRDRQAREVSHKEHIKESKVRTERISEEDILISSLRRRSVFISLMCSLWRINLSSVLCFGAATIIPARLGFDLNRRMGDAVAIAQHVLCFA